MQRCCICWCGVCDSTSRRVWVGVAVKQGWSLLQAEAAGDARQCCEGLAAPGMQRVALHMAGQLQTEAPTNSKDAGGAALAGAAFCRCTSRRMGMLLQ